MFETQEKRREIQKEIERAQQLLADAHEVGEVEGTPSEPDEEYDEGEELQKVSVSFILYSRVNRSHFFPSGGGGGGGGGGYSWYRTY